MLNVRIVPTHRARVRPRAREVDERLGTLAVELFDTAFAQCPLVAILRGVKPDECVAIGDALSSGAVLITGSVVTVGEARTLLGGRK